MSDTFFRFPLRALSAFESPSARLNKIVDYCVMDVGAKHLATSVVATATPAERRRHAFEMGCKVLKVVARDGADVWTQRNHDELLKHCGTEAQATVSIRADWLWECLYGLRGEEREMPVSYREFSVLCAILSKLGNKELESCTWQEIQCRALGYTTGDMMKKMLPYHRKDGAKALTRQQIRSTLDDLTNNRFFARHAVGNGTRTWLTYYSFKMDEKALETAAMAAWMRRRRRGRQPWTPGKKERAAKVWAMRHTLNGEGAKPASNPEPRQNH